MLLKRSWNVNGLPYDRNGASAGFEGKFSSGTKIDRNRVALIIDSASLLVAATRDISKNGV